MMNYIIVPLCNIFLLFIIWQYYNDILTPIKEQRHIRLITGIMWCVIALGLSELFHSPLVNIVSSVILLILMTIPYHGSNIKKILIAVMVEAINAACDYLAFRLFSYIYHSENVYAISYIGTVIFAYIAEIITRQFFNRNKADAEIGWRSVAILLIIPISMLIIMCSMAQSEIDEGYLTITLVCVLINCFSPFYLYDVIVADRIKAMETQSLNEKVESYKRELEKIEATEIRIEGIRHDLHHHIIEMQSMAAKGESDKLSDYLKQIAEDINNDIRVSHTGRYEVDSLINYIIGNAKEVLKEVSAKVSLPEDLNIEKYRLNIIVGNLLENALEAAMQSERQFMSLEIGTQRGMLFIDVRNSYNGCVIRENGQIKSAKSLGSEHGLGLKNVKRIVDESDGEMRISYDDEIFRATVMLYIQL